jgi:hypothetical protein
VAAAGWRTRFAELFALPRLSPGLVAASALLLVCAVAGLLMMRGERQPVEVVNNPRPTPAPQTGSAPASTPEQTQPTDGAVNPVSPAVNEPADRQHSGELAKIKPKGAGVNESAKGFPPKGVGGTNQDKYRPKGAGGVDVARAGAEEAKLPREVVDVPFVIPPRVDVEAREFAEAEVAANDTTRPDAAKPGLSAARHAEQAQMLLRSFRNASAAGGADLSYERERSQELLYQNIVLRREAARGGNANVESTLSQLETILLDIANLPDKPAGEDVRSIKSRMERKNIVAMLQVASRD